MSEKVKKISDDTFFSVLAQDFEDLSMGETPKRQSHREIKAAQYTYYAKRMIPIVLGVGSIGGLSYLFNQANRTFLNSL
jgi:hypothetical protein